MTNRRGFIIGLSAALAAPAIVRASSLMRVVVPKRIMPPMTATEVLLRQLRAKAMDRITYPPLQYSIELGGNVTLTPLRPTASDIAAVEMLDAEIDRVMCYGPDAVWASMSSYPKEDRYRFPRINSEA